MKLHKTCSTAPQTQALLEELQTVAKRNWPLLATTLIDAYQPAANGAESIFCSRLKVAPRDTTLRLHRLALCDRILIARQTLTPSCVFLIYTFFFHTIQSVYSSTYIDTDTMTADSPAKKECMGADCQNEAGSLQCPTCLKLGVKDSYFCSQECFKRNWVGEFHHVVTAAQPNSSAGHPQDNAQVAK